MKIVIHNNKTRIMEADVLVAKSIRIYTAEFYFDAEWDGFAVTAVFENGGVRYEQPLIGVTSCVIPWEVLEKPGYLYISVYGTKGDQRKVSIVSDGQFVRFGAEPGEKTKDPTPDQYEQIMAAIQAGKIKGDTGRSAYEYAVAGGYTGSEEEFASVTAYAAIAEAAAKQYAESAAEAAGQAETAAAHMPVIGTDNYWYLWDTESGGYTKTGVLAEGQTGAAGEAGPKGDKGDTGAVPNISVEAVGLPAGSVPTASRSGTDENPLFSFGIPKGDTGPQGEKGDPGPQGIQGETGPAGSPGADGGYYSPAVDADGNLSWTASHAGMPAVAGVNIKGPKGDSGQAGADGADGAKGEKGDPGPQGIQGETGPAGSPGADGGYYSPAVDADGNLSWTASREGMPAVTGANIKGPKGDTGQAGADGADGAKGEKGDPGPQGIQGETGPAGSPGADGGYYSPAVDADGNLSWTASREGMPAVTGANIKGPKGDTGQAGADGADGAKGDKGDKGDAGADGYTPVKGTDYWTAADKTEIENDLKTWAGQQGYITAVDSALSATSENPVQNKVIYAQLGDISAALDAIINGSSTA